MTNDEKIPNPEYPKTKGEPGVSATEAGPLRHWVLGIGHSFVIRASSFVTPREGVVPDDPAGQSGNWVRRTDRLLKRGKAGRKLVLIFPSFLTVRSSHGSTIATRPAGVLGRTGVP